MRENVFICDLCHARVEETKWYLQAHELYLKVYLPGSVIKYGEVCNECREAVAAQIAAAVKSRLELRGVRDD